MLRTSQKVPRPRWSCFQKIQNLLLRWISPRESFWKVGGGTLPGDEVIYWPQSLAKFCRNLTCGSKMCFSLFLFLLFFLWHKKLNFENENLPPRWILNISIECTFLKSSRWRSGQCVWKNSYTFGMNKEKLGSNPWLGKIISGKER